MLEIERLSKTFARGGLFRRGEPVTALSDVSLSVAAGESFGLVGESGSGKSTLARCILRLDRPSAGRIRFEGDDMAALTPAAMRRLRARIQVVWQDPYASLNPRMSVHDIVTEPMLIHRRSIGLDARARTQRAAEILAQVGLGAQYLHRHPHEFSGGQRQRIGIARALATSPALLLLDEPTSALDVSVQAQVLNLLCDLQARLGLTYFFISHDLAVIRYVCDRVALLHRGAVVEQGPTAEIFDRPQSPHTRSLLAAMPEVVVPPG
jgi:ABC-type glutathione transport system ATPase component